MFSTTQRIGRPKTKTFGQTLLASVKACKTVYKLIIEKKATTPLKSQGKWLSEENITGNANVNQPRFLSLRRAGSREPWERGWMWTGSRIHTVSFSCEQKQSYECSNSFLYRRIATNDFLFKLGLKQAESCSFCGEFTETLAHLFWYCKYT